MSAPANPDVYAYRWGQDVADANTPTYLAGNSTSYEIAQSDLDTTVFYLYMGIENDGDMAANDAYQLQHDSAGGGSPTWVSITTSSTYVRTIAGQDTDADAITSTPSDFTDGAGTFTNGEYSDATASITDANLNGGTHSVHVYAIQFQSAQLSGGETVTFRLTHGGTPCTNDQVATCTIAASGPITSSGTPSLPALEASGAAAVNPADQTATGTPSLPALTSSGVAEIIRTSSGTPAFPALQASGVAEIEVPGSGTVNLPALQASGVASVNGAPPAQGGKVAGMSAFGSMMIRR